MFIYMPHRSGPPPKDEELGAMLFWLSVTTLGMRLLVWWQDWERGALAWITAFLCAAVFWFAVAVIYFIACYIKTLLPKRTRKGKP